MVFVNIPVRVFSQHPKGDSAIFLGQNLTPRANDPRWMTSTCLGHVVKGLQAELSPQEVADIPGTKAASHKQNERQAFLGRPLAAFYLLVAMFLEKGFPTLFDTFQRAGPFEQLPVMLRQILATGLRGGEGCA
jgi:hypothetical protein